MKSLRATHNLLAVSAFAREQEMNQFQDLDLTLLVELGNVINLEYRKETNEGEQNGKEEADMIYNLGQTSALSISFPKAQPQHFVFMYAYALGQLQSESAGAGYLKTITPYDGDLDRYRSLPGFTAAQRLGKTVVKERFASMFVNSVTSTFSKDEFVKLSGSIIGTGKHERSVIEETVSAAKNATSLTLAANSVQGAKDKDRLDSIHQIRVELSPGIFHEVDYSAVSEASPAEITITAPDAAADIVNYKILYQPSETAWMSFPNMITETPLRVSRLTFQIGGAYDGNSFIGGREMGPEISSIEHSLENNGSVEFTPGAGDDYASTYFREGRKQTLKLNREFREFILQNYLKTSEYFGASVLAEGMEYEYGHKYSVELIFPRLAVLNSPVSVDGKKLAEAGDMSVLEHDTYGSVIVKIKNLQQNCAA